MANRLLFPEYIEAGAGPLVVLVHASMSGARQWTALMQALQDRFHLRALNLFGYGRTPAWPARQAPTLDDYADLVAAAVLRQAQGVTLIGHSFGGAVAMQAALRLASQVSRLVLIEPSIFALLRPGGRYEAHAEIAAVRDAIEYRAPEEAAQRFIGYWTGPASWDATPPERKAAYVRQVARVRGEFGAAFASLTALEEWAVVLPRQTLVVSAEDTKRSSREVVELLRLAAPYWRFGRVAKGGHMSPLTAPDPVNSVIASFLDQPV